MHVRLQKPWNGRRVGHVFAAMPDGQANVLIKRGIAAPVSAPSQKTAKREKPRKA